MAKNTKAEKKGGIKEFFKGTKSELKKVSWPNKKELTNYTIVVLATCFIMTVVIWVLDLIFHQFLSIFIS